MTDHLTVSCWHGRSSAPGTIHCTRHGRAEQTWERRDGRWTLVAMTLRPVIGFEWTETGWQPTLGEAREVALCSREGG